MSSQPPSLRLDQEKLLCSDHAKRLSIDPGGSALAVDRILLVDVAPPWPKPATAHPLLNEIDALIQSSSVPTRLLAALPQTNKSALSISHYQRTGSSIYRTRYNYQSATEALQVCSHITGSQTELDIQQEEAPNEILICTQGSHDVCCGSEGTRLANLAAKIENLSVRRTSHTGGHRFAPTGISMPNGRMWANLNFDLLNNIMNSSGEPSELAKHCRGWVGAKKGPAQIAERAVFSKLGWQLDKCERTITVKPVADDIWNCYLEVKDQLGQRNVWQVDVTKNASIAGITCRAEGGLPNKMVAQYTSEIVVGPEPL